MIHCSDYWRRILNLIFFITFLFMTIVTIQLIVKYEKKNKDVVVQFHSGNSSFLRTRSPSSSPSPSTTVFPNISNYPIVVNTKTVLHYIGEHCLPNVFQNYNFTYNIGNDTENTAMDIRIHFFEWSIYDTSFVNYSRNSYYLSCDNGQQINSGVNNLKHPVLNKTFPYLPLVDGISNSPKCSQEYLVRLKIPLENFKFQLMVEKPYQYLEEYWCLYISENTMSIENTHFQCGEENNINELLKITDIKDIVTFDISALNLTLDRIYVRLNEKISTILQSTEFPTEVPTIIVN